jgi:hypothetical protein
MAVISGLQAEIQDLRLAVRGLKPVFFIREI